MPTVFSHAIAGAALARTIRAEDARKLMIAAVISAMVPDLDAIGFMTGVPYGSFFGHRGFTHSITFAVLWSALVTVLLFRKAPWPAALLLFLATVSHPLLDMLTSGGLGCTLFAPFNNERLFFPWQPIKVSPLGFGFFSARGLAVLASEAVWVVLPSVILLLVTKRRRSACKAPSPNNGPG
ncbi:MAG: metal-dependent hydrolase [Flavobacteriales bacterium]|nr:metal-dependent hydrolase [Flavobacteriales bacterium]